MSDLHEIDDEITDEDLIEEIEGDTEAAQLAQVEAKARSQGWRPLNEYRGPPGRWVDAATFLERGDKFLPFVQRDRDEARAEVQRVRGEIENLRKTIDEQQDIMQELRQFARNADAAGYQRAKADLEGKMRAAVAEGNTETFDEVKEQLDSLVEGRAERAAAERKAPPPATAEPPEVKPVGQVAPEVQQFMNENPWFTTDRVLNAAMVEEHTRLQREVPGLSLADNLEQAKEAVMAQFPQKFGQAPRQAAPRSRTVSAPRAPAPQKGEGWESITDPTEREEAKKAYLKMKRHMPDYTAKEYLAVYHNPHADVRSIRQAAKRKE